VVTGSGVSSVVLAVLAAIICISLDKGDTKAIACFPDLAIAFAVF